MVNTSGSNVNFKADEIEAIQAFAKANDIEVNVVDAAPGLFLKHERPVHYPLQLIITRFMNPGEKTPVFLIKGRLEKNRAWDRLGEASSLEELSLIVADFFSKNRVRPTFRLVGNEPEEPDSSP